MRVDGIYLVTSKLLVAGTQEIASLQQAFQSSFPKGYAEFATCLGLGYLDGLISMYLPGRILESSKAFRDAWSVADRWSEGRSSLDRTSLVECIAIGETNYQDTIVFHPSEPDCCYVLPAERPTIFAVGDKGMWGTVDWILDSGVLMQKSRPLIEYSTTGELAEVDFHTFEATVDRVSVEMFGKTVGSYDLASAKCLEVFLALPTSRIFYRGGIHEDLGFWVYERASAGRIHCDCDDERRARLHIAYDSQADASTMEQFINSLERVGFRTYRY